MVLDYYGLFKTEKELVNLTGCKPKIGVNAEGIISAAKTLGFQAYKRDFARFEDIKTLLDKKIPVIVDWFSTDDGHYSVVVGLNKKNIYLQDPEIGGIRTIDKQTFFRIWFDFPGDFLKSERDLIIRRIIVITPKDS